MKYFVIIKILILISFNCFSSVKEYYIPSKAFIYGPIVYKEINRLIKDHPKKHYFYSLIEHESCIYLLHIKCWDPTSRLKTKREEGAGLAQLTRAYRKDGSIRFDTINNLRKEYMEELKYLTWKNVYKRPDLQIKAMILLYRKNYNYLNKVIKDEISLLAMADAAYNGGLKGVNRDRSYCKLLKNCNKNIWFNNVEKTCTKSKKILYANKNACDINRYHVRDVLLIRINKYLDYYNLLDLNKDYIDKKLK